MARTKYPSAQYCYSISFPPGMRERVKEAAKTNHRTMNAEIVHRLQEFEKQGEARNLSEVITQLQEIEKRLGSAASRDQNQTVTGECHEQ